MALAAGAVGGGIFLLFHIAGGMGAGDVKLMTAIACLVGFHSLVQVLAMTAIMGGVFALCLAIARGKLKETIFNIGSLMNHHRMAGLTPHPDLNLDNRQTLRLPYAIAIAAGCLITFCSDLSLR
jgi:prepilin peptidase CpaA